MGASYDRTRYRLLMSTAYLTHGPVSLEQPPALAQLFSGTLNQRLVRKATFTVTGATTNAAQTIAAKAAAANQTSAQA